MARETGFGSIAVTQSFTDQYVYSDGIGLPTGRVMDNGSRACLITAVRAYAAGRGATRSMSISLGSATTGSFAVGSAGSAQDTGWKSITPYLVQGGSVRFTLNLTGSTFFGRGLDGSGVDSYGNNFGTLGGGYLWAQSPSSPGFNDLSASSTGVVHVNIAGPSDDGGANIIGYQVQWAKNSSFTSGLQYSNRGTGTDDLDFNVTGLDAGTTYYFRVAARNAVTNAAGTTGPFSAVQSLTPSGPPSAPRSMTAAAVSGSLDTMLLDWTAPSDTAGGITGYDIWNDGTLYKRINGTATEYTATGLDKNATYRWYVRARNDWVDGVKQFGAADPSNVVTITNWSSASNVRNVTATASSSVAGRISLSWQAPATVGQGITRYAIYNSTGSLISYVPNSQTSYNVDGLVPGTYYAFYVLAYTAVSDAASKADNKSNTAGATALGAPIAPTSPQALSSATVAGRLVLTWVQPGTYTGFNVYDVTTGTAVLLATVTQPRMVLDNLTPSLHQYVVAARNAVTDATNPPTEGTRSAVFSGTPGQTSSQATTAFTVPNLSNAVYNGTYTVNSMTPTSISYLKTAANMASTLVPSGVGTLLDTTNAALSGVHPITANPSAYQFSFSATVPDVPANTSVAAVTATNQTNQTFTTTTAAPGTVTASNSGTFSVSYSNAGSDVAAVTASGTITNKSNAVYNGTAMPILTIPASNQFTYAKTNANLAQTGATGTATNATNRDQYNYPLMGGVPATVLSTPAFNKLTYAVSGSDQATVAITSNYGVAYRAYSRATLNIKYRSGWAG
jgi:hypothetical protein